MNINKKITEGFALMISGSLILKKVNGEIKHSDSDLNKEEITKQLLLINI